MSQDHRSSTKPQTRTSTTTLYRALPLKSGDNNCRRATLVLENSSLQDSGLYLLVVRNTYHIAEAKFNLDIGSNLIKAAFSEDVNNIIEQVDVSKTFDSDDLWSGHQDPLVSDNKLLLDSSSVLDSGGSSSDASEIAKQQTNHFFNVLFVTALCLTLFNF